MWRTVALSGIGLCLSMPALAVDAGLATLHPGVNADFDARSLPDLSVQLKGWLQQSFKDAGLSVQIEPQGSWGLQPGYLPVLHGAIKTLSVTNEGWQVTVILSQTGQFGGAASLPELRFRAVALKTVWVSIVPLRKGDAVLCGQLMQRTLPSRRSQPTWQGSCETLLTGMRVRRPLQPGDVLMLGDIGQLAAVQDQQEAIVTTRMGQIEIQAKGVALADAQIGQQVPVKVNGRAAVIHAVVTAPGQVQVMEGVR